MYHFFTETEFFMGSEAVITGPDVNHIKNVLRMKPGERILLSDGKGTNCLGELEEIGSDRITVKLLPEEVEDTELPVEVTLYQGLPKGDKMEFIIQKAVELGAAGIVPVMMKRTVVKLEDKKKDKKRERYQMIAESAAKQSGRGIIPEVTGFMSFREALQYAGKFDLLIVPYESADGGFAKEEIDVAKEAGAKIITLGNRILRTETAGLAVLSILMFQMEQ